MENDKKEYLTLIEKNGLDDLVLDDYASGMSIGEISRKYTKVDLKLTWEHVAYFVRGEEEGNTPRWRRALDRRTVNVFNELSTMNKTVKDMLKEYEDLKTQNPKQGPQWNREIRATWKIQLEHLRTYADTVEKWLERREFEELKQAFVETLKEADPDVAAKVLTKLREYKEKREALQLK